MPGVTRPGPRNGLLPVKPSSGCVYWVSGLTSTRMASPEQKAGSSANARLAGFFGVIGGGGFLAFLGWVRFTDFAEESAFRRELEEIEHGPVRTSQQRAAERDAVRDWADQELRRVRRRAGRES